MYCTPLDLIAHANKARLIGQLAGSDYERLPAADAVLAYFTDGTADADDIEALDALKARVQQAIDNATGDIDGYLALVPSITLPANTLHAACMDMALYRLSGNLDDSNVIKLLNDQRHAFFDKLVTGKYPINSDDSTKSSSGSAETIGDDVFFTADRLEGY